MKLKKPLLFTGKNTSINAQWTKPYYHSIIHLIDILGDSSVNAWLRLTKPTLDSGKAKWDLQLSWYMNKKDCIALLEMLKMVINRLRGKKTHWPSSSRFSSWECQSEAVMLDCGCIFGTHIFLIEEDSRRTKHIPQTLSHGADLASHMEDIYKYTEHNIIHLSVCQSGCLLACVYFLRLGWTVCQFRWRLHPLFTFCILSNRWFYQT